MASLPTCWYCPECDIFCRSRFDPKMTECHADGTAVLGTFIPPASPPEQILNLVGDVRAIDPGDGLRYLVTPRTEATDGDH